MKVLTIGGATVDTIVTIDDHLIEQMTLSNADASYLLLEVGRKSEAKAVSVHCGGGSINTAVAMARLGHDVSAVAKIGRDLGASMILSQLSAEGVSPRYALHHDQAPTGTSIFIAAHDRNTAVITFRGANTTFTLDDLDNVSFAVDLVYVASLSDQSADCFPHIVSRAKSGGALVAANPGIRQLSTRQGAFWTALANIDILSLNRTEAAALVPGLLTRGGHCRPCHQPDFPTHPAGPRDTPELVRCGFACGDGQTMALAAFFQTLTTLGPRWIVVTDGKDGAYIGTPSHLTLCPALPVDIVGTAGAGDAFNATFAAFIQSGVGIDDAAIAAAINSASVVGHLDTQTGLLQRQHLEVQIKEKRDGMALRHWPHDNQPVAA
jgi:ribokinase